MTEKDNSHPHLTLVDQQHDSQADEFIPLPFYPWDERPSTLPLDPEEVATAIHLAEGDLPRAAEFLKTPRFRLERLIKHSPRLQRILDEHLGLHISRASAEYIRALDSPNDRRREWAASKLLASRAASQHPFAPAPPQSTSSASLSLAQTPTQRTLTFRWRTDEDDALDALNGNSDGDDAA